MVELEVWSFDVTLSTNALLRGGVCEAVTLNGETYHRVVVAAETFDEAFLIAGQMASCAPLAAVHGRRLRIPSDTALARAQARGERVGTEPEEEGGVMCTGVYPRI